ncbi:MAG: asparagine synthetase B, partial [Deltaproteobacteria bacterium]|nr:asparagine synthetase B [Deltaproteobacteria bacterium]
MLPPRHCRPDAPSLARDLCAALAHRGPDDFGWAAFAQDGSLIGTEREHAALDGRAAALLLGQTRLSIIDLSSAGHQPMRSADGRYTLIYNGEIYNYPELRAELEAEGARFAGGSDTEVLLQALMRWGDGCLPRLVGMFAFALHDSARQRLFLARDCFGIKPLYWHNGSAGFAFASEMPALLRFPGTPRRLSAQSVYDYLCFAKYDKGGDTFFQDIFQLPPAHCLSLDTRNGVVSGPERFWKPDLAERSSLSFPEATVRLRELFL